MKKVYLLLLPAFLLSCSQKAASPSVVSSVAGPEAIAAIFSEDGLTPKIPSPAVEESFSVEAADIPEIEPPTSDPIRIYLNPSVQTANYYYNNVATEAEMMNKVSEKIYEELSRDSRFEVYCNDRYLPLAASVKESNSLKVDYHLALHSNAGGGSGSEVYYTGSSSFASLVLDTFAKHHPFANRGVKSGSHLYELKHSTATNRALIEFLFHDNKAEAEFIVSNYTVLAMAMVEAFVALL